MDESMPREKKDISIKKAAFLNAGAKYSNVIIQLIYNGILSRILTPEEFGIIAVINVFIVFFQLFADMGFGTAVVQDKSLTDDQTNDIFSFTIYLGIVLMLLFSALSFPIAAIYGDRIYVRLGLVLSLSLLFNAFNMIPNAILLKEKRFVAIAIRTVVVSIASCVLTIFFAKAGLGVYALAIYSVIHALSLFIWNEISAKCKFRICFRIGSIKKVWGYSMFQFGAQTLNYFNRNLDNLLIGKYFSATDLGYYNKAYTLTRYPVTYLPGVITPVMHPILSDHQNDKEYIYRCYLRILKFLSLLGCFGAMLCFFAGKEIILIAFGKQWESSVLPFQIMSLSLWMQILTNTTAPVYQSIGNTKLLFRSTVYNTILIISSIIIGVLMGSIVTVSICVSIGYILNFILSFGILVRIAFKKKLLDFAQCFWQEFVFFAVMLIIAIIWPFEIENLILSFAAKTIVFILVYCLLLVITRQHKVLLSFVKNK
jgi:PST family polysaccharide transporter